MALHDEDITEAIIGAAIEVHRHLGPGLLESAYRRCLVHELRLRGVAVASEVSIDLEYKGLLVPASYRLDLLARTGWSSRSRPWTRSPPSTRPSCSRTCASRGASPASSSTSRSSSYETASPVGSCRAHTAPLDKFFEVCWWGKPHQHTPFSPFIGWKPS